MHCRRRPRRSKFSVVPVACGGYGVIKAINFSKAPASTARPLWRTYNRHRILILLEKEESEKNWEKKRKESAVFLHVSPPRSSEIRIGHRKIIRIIKFQWNWPNIELPGRNIENSPGVWNFANSHNSPKNTAVSSRRRNRSLPLVFPINAALFNPLRQLFSE